MKRVKNLTENKVLINTFKKSKLKNYLNKSFLKKKDFFLLKYRQPKFKFFFKFFSKSLFYRNIFKTFFFLKQKNIFLNSQKSFNLVKITLMFIN